MENTTTVGPRALQLIEPSFAFLIGEYGFALAQSTAVPVEVWYRNGKRAISLAYDQTTDAALDITLDAPELVGPILMSDLLRFSTEYAGRKTDILSVANFIAELERASTILKTMCVEFLRGDVAAFRKRYREAVMVQAMRRIAQSAFYTNDTKRSTFLYEVFQDYWDDVDREYHSLASRDEKPAWMNVRKK